MGGDTFENTVKKVMPNGVKEKYYERDPLAKEVKIEHVCDATRILAQYEEWLDKEKNTVYRDCGHRQQICTECWNKLQEIKKNVKQ